MALAFAAPETDTVAEATPELPDKLYVAEGIPTATLTLEDSPPYETTIIALPVPTGVISPLWLTCATEVLLDA